jgi:hypothetical protein
MFFAHRTFAASSRVSKSRRFSQDQSRARKRSSEKRQDDPTRPPHKSRERTLLHSWVCPLPSYPPSTYIDMLNQFISYNVRYPTKQRYKFRSAGVESISRSRFNGLNLHRFEKSRVKVGGRWVKRLRGYLYLCFGGNFVGCVWYRMI